jgi:tetratricopeptide (TPR) repeat protein
MIRRIKAYEAGEHRPNDPYRLLYCRVFGMEEAELFSTSTEQHLRDSAEVLAELLPGDLSSQVTALAGRRAGIHVVADLSARVHGLRLADDVLGANDLLAPAFRELHTAVRLYRESIHGEDVRQGMLTAIGEFAQIAGWIASDAGHHERASRTYLMGISAAREAGDGTLESNLLGSLAYQVADVGDSSEAVRLARDAVRAAGPDAPPRGRALSWDRLAWAYARAGDAQETVRALGEASTALAAHNAESEPSYLYWLDANELKIMEARAYTELRRPLRAVPLLIDVLKRYDATHARELALYLSWLAVALADAHEPEEAARTAQRMLELSIDLSSRRTVERARVVLRRLEPYRDVPEVRELFTKHHGNA